VLLRWQEFASRSAAVFFLHATGVAVPVANIGRVKARVVNWKQVDVVASNRSGCPGKR